MDSYQHTDYQQSLIIRMAVARYRKDKIKLKWAQMQYAYLNGSRRWWVV